MSTKSTNTFTVTSSTTSVNSFTAFSPTTSTNSFARYSKNSSANAFGVSSFGTGTNGFGGRNSMYVASQNGWDGDNLTGDYFANVTDFEGEYFGQGNFGGIRHFNK